MGFYISSAVFLAILGVICAQDVTSAPDPAPTESAATDAPPLPADLPHWECNSPGMMCSALDKCALCMNLGAKGFHQEEVQCPTGTYCNGNGNCTGTVCPYRKFKCADEGMFPDCYDFKKYHVCVYDNSKHALNTIDLECLPNERYNASAMTCQEPQTADPAVPSARTPVPICEKELQCGNLEQDKSIAYVCAKENGTLAPKLFRCGSGEEFDVTQISCVPAKKGKKSKK